MSMVSNLAKNLRDYAKEYNYLSNHTKDRNVLDLLLVAADTIEELSAKVARQNMERSSQYYGGGWISCSEMLPETSDSMLVAVQYVDRNIIIDIGFFDSKITNRFGKWNIDCAICHVIAWQPLPPVYEPKED